MDLQEKINYILNFDESKLFHTDLDDMYTNKNWYLEDIKFAKEKYLKYKNKQKMVGNTVRAFDFCNMYMTDTPHQALANYIVVALNPKYSEFLWFIDYLVSELKKVEERNESA